MPEKIVDNKKMFDEIKNINFEKCSELIKYYDFCNTKENIKNKDCSTIVYNFSKLCGTGK